MGTLTLQGTGRRKNHTGRIGGVLVASALLLSGVSCAGYEKEKIHQKYAGSTVVDKKIATRTRQEPIRNKLYVLPNGQIICQVEEGYISIECESRAAYFKKKYKLETRTVMQDTGQFRNVNYDEYYLVLKSPDGIQTTQQVNDVQFRESIIGERLGLKSTDPTARRTALNTEIAAAEKDLEAAVAQREAKEREKERADRTRAAARKQGKGGKKGKAGEAAADTVADRTDQELEALVMNEEDKRLRLTQLQQERADLDKPKDAPASPQPAAAAPAPAQ